MQPKCADSTCSGLTRRNKSLFPFIRPAPVRGVGIWPSSLSCGSGPVALLDGPHFTSCRIVSLVSPRFSADLFALWCDPRFSANLFVKGCTPRFIADSVVAGSIFSVPRCSSVPSTSSSAPTTSFNLFSRSPQGSQYPVLQAVFLLQQMCLQSVLLFYQMCLQAVLSLQLQCRRLGLTTMCPGLNGRSSSLLLVQVNPMAPQVPLLRSPTPVPQLFLLSQLHPPPRSQSCGLLGRYALCRRRARACCD